MSRLLARIMLALLMLPLGGVLFAMSMAVVIELFNVRDEELGFSICVVVVALFVGIYWLMLWRSTVRWDSNRVILTAVAGVGTLITGVVIGASVAFVDPSFGIMIGGLLAILLWLAATIFVWQECASERIARIRGHGANTIACPVCGYNMTGLTHSVCPECGSRFTISELVAAQSDGEANELEAAPQD